MVSETIAKLAKTEDVFSEENQLLLSKMGFPTFDEFKKNPDSYRAVKDQLLASADQGSVDLRSLVRSHKYEILGYACKNLEMVQRVASDEGIAIDQLEMKPEIIPIGGGKCDILVRFEKKS
jgi:hypothetical protein